MYVFSKIPCHEAGEEAVNNICITANSWFYSNWFIQKNLHLICIECICCTLPTASIRKVPSNNVCIDIFVLLSLKSLLWKLFYLCSKRPIETLQVCVCVCVCARACVQYVFLCYWTKYSDHIVPDICSVIYIQFTHMKNWIWKWYMVGQKKLRHISCLVRRYNW